jgi:hypothetical protein
MKADNWWNKDISLFFKSSQSFLIVSKYYIQILYVKDKHKNKCARLTHRYIN